MAFSTSMNYYKYINRYTNKFIDKFLKNNRVIKIARKNSFLNFLKNILKEFYYNISDKKINDLSSLKTEKVLKYLERLDISSPKSYLLLRSALKHQDKTVILKTIDILKENKNINSRKLLNTLLNNKDTEIIIAAIDALRVFRIMIL